MAGGPGGVRPLQTPGVCKSNAPDCGAFGRACCVTTSGAATGLQVRARAAAGCRLPAPLRPAAAGLTRASPAARHPQCGARWDENGPRGYCADPADLAAANSSSSGGGAAAKRRAPHSQLVCTRCPSRTADVAANPSKYWPC